MAFEAKAKAFAIGELIKAERRSDSASEDFEDHFPSN
jgi:hypothetical protein